VLALVIVVNQQLGLIMLQLDAVSSNCDLRLPSSYRHLGLSESHLSPTCPKFPFGDSRRFEEQCVVHG